MKTIPSILFWRYNMKTIIPNPIRNHLFMYFIALISFVFIGIVLGVACSDKVIVLLTAGILIFGTVRLTSLQGLAVRGNYEKISGVVLSDLRLHRKHKLLMRTEVGEEIMIMLSGRPSFQVGSKWTIYVSQKDPGIDSNKLPLIIVPSRMLLGKVQN